MMGSSTHLHVNAEGKDTIIVVNSGEGVYHTGAQIRFKIPAKQMHLFDRKTGKNLLVK